MTIGHMKPVAADDGDGRACRRPGSRPSMPASAKISAGTSTSIYGDKQALKDVDLDIPPRQVTALIGPSGCGKSTFLRCLNRMNDMIDGCRVTGKITLDGEDIYDRKLDVVQLRARVGMVFQKPNPFPKSIYDNVAYGPRIHGIGTGQAPRWTRSSRRSLERGRPVERGEGPAAAAGHRPVRRPAAAALHRPRHRGQSGGDPDGRALLGARPDRHRAHRGADGRAARELHHRHRHPLHAAGGARVAAHRLLPSRASWWNRATRNRSSPARGTSAPRATSPAGSAEPEDQQWRHGKAIGKDHIVKSFDEELKRLRQRDRSDGRPGGGTAAEGGRRAGQARQRWRRAR